MYVYNRNKNSDIYEIVFLAHVSTIEATANFYLIMSKY